MEKKYTDEKLIIVVENSKTIANVLDNLNLAKSGSSYKRIKANIKRLNISTNHFVIEHIKPGKAKRYSKEEFISNFLCLNGPKIKSSKLKEKLVRFELLKYECKICKNKGIWLNKPIVLQLDHINGNHKDNRLENLRILCPNCHTQTETWGAKKLNKEKTWRKGICVDCGGKISTGSNRCIKCRAIKDRKVERPSYDQLLKEVNELGYCATGRKYKVSDNSIRKWIKNYTKN